MTCLDIIEYPDPRLREASQAVTRFDEALERLAGDLLDTLHATGGIGLCAPQVGIQRRLLVIDLSGTQSAPEVYVNPEILERSPVRGMVEESCLSVPGVTANVVRSLRVKVRAQDLAGQTFEKELENMHAVCLQHELDHLDGKLFIDRLPFLRRRRARATADAHARRSSRGAGDVATRGV